MYVFLVPLMAGFTLNCASAFTTAFSRRFGSRNSQIICFILRMVIAMPLWFLGLVMAMRYEAQVLFNSSPLLEGFAWLLIFAGCAVIAWALAGIGVRAALPSIDDRLVASGAYALVRHPIYSGMFLVFAGLFLLRPILPVGLACALGWGWLVLQARMEEIDLIERIPGYQDYMGRVPRFLPRRAGRHTR
jgi:protein-S-isoprenylcysteine O-methyltransferase Ste14